MQPGRARLAVPTALTFARIPLGVAIVCSALHGSVGLCFDLYVLGTLTDVADGWSARALRATSEFGKRWDMRTDMAFNSLSYVALALLLWPEGLDWRSASLALLLLAFASSLFWISAEQPAAKVRSGVVRVALVVLLLSQLVGEALAWRLAVALGVGVVGGLYELGVMRRSR